MGGGLLWFFLGAGAATMYHHKHTDHNSESQSGWGRCHAHLRANGPHQALPPLNAAPGGQAPSPSFANDSLPGPSHSAATPPTGPVPDPWAAEKERMMEIGKQVGVNVGFFEAPLQTLLMNICIVGYGVLGKHSGYIIVKY